MNITLLSRARRHFINEMTPVHTSRHNMRQWVRSIRMLSNTWKLAKPAPQTVLAKQARR